MAPTRLTRTVVACLAALACAVALGACSKKDQGTVDEPAREGLALNVGGIDYNVFITRELNLRIPPDKAYYKGPEAPPGKLLYGIFIQACNKGKKTLTSSRPDQFVVEDNQGNEYHPKELPADNAFAYSAARLAPKDCIPQKGSVAQLGPTAGSMLLYEFPLANTENRPLELIIHGPFDLLKGKRPSKRVELDI
jgi:hypothetical protein